MSSSTNLTRTTGGMMLGAVLLAPLAPWTGAAEAGERALYTGAAYASTSRTVAVPKIYPEVYPEVYRGEPVLGPAELRAARGGLRAMGVEFEFGAHHRVAVDGTLVAETRFTMAPDGAISRQLEIHDGRATEFDGSATPVPGIGIDALKALGGVVITDGKGSSVALAGVAPGAISNALINRANDRNVSGRLDVTLEIHGFSELQSRLTGAEAASQLGATVERNLLSSF